MTVHQHSVKVSYKLCKTLSSENGNKNHILDLRGLGGQVDGYNIEHAVICPTSPFIYELKSKMTLADLKMPVEYVTAFNPVAFLKVWIR